jgi:superfamily II DNA/RNA helicase
LQLTDRRTVRGSRKNDQPTLQRYNRRYRDDTTSRRIIQEAAHSDSDSWKVRHSSVPDVIRFHKFPNNCNRVYEYYRRLVDHLRSCDTFSLKAIRFLVIDEADRLLGGRFNDDLKTIFDALPKRKQILMFSATLTDSIEQVKQITSKEVMLVGSLALSTFPIKTYDVILGVCVEIRRRRSYRR